MEICNRERYWVQLNPAKASRIYSWGAESGLRVRGWKIRVETLGLRRILVKPVQQDSC